RVVTQFGVRTNNNQAVLGADIELELLFERIGQAAVFEAVSPYPAVREDLALIVNHNQAASDVADAIRQAGGFLLKDVVLFDVYQGPQLPHGKKSLAYHLTFQSPSKTLTDKDVSKQRKRIIATLENRLGARLRE
ncbi:MAG: phenylalanine--tRNA ligase subunit beta, partial [Candidatus Promineifilaceae bacterium]